MGFGTALWRALFTYLALLFLARLMGQKQVAQLTFPNYVVGITIGSIAASIAVDETIPFWAGVGALLVWTALPVLTDILTLRNRTARALLEGEPTVVIHKGHILDQNMGKIRYNMNELLAQLRNSQIFDPQQVEYAVLETDGKLSILSKAQYQTATKGDVGAASDTQQQPLPAELIVDGTVYPENLRKVGRDQNWLHKQLLASGLSCPSEVALAVLQSDGTLFVDPKGQPASSHNGRPPID